RAATSTYKRQVAQRYSEGTLLRLLESSDVLTRRAAVLALAMLGSMTANEPVSARLHDEDEEVRQIATDAMWKIWFRGDSDANNLELQRLARVRDRQKAAAGLDRLIEKAPHFAEAYNQRAIVAFGMKQYDRSIAD